MRRQLLIWSVAVIGLLIGTGTAWAHNVLVNSDPVNGSSVAAGPAKVTLKFDLPVQQSFSTVTVLGPDGLHYEGGPSQVDGNSVSAPVNPLGAAGKYTVGYRIVSDDGHPVSGSISFTLTQAGTGKGVPAAAAQPEGDSADSQDSESGGIPAWPWILGGVLLVAAGAAFALRMGRGSDD
ncbi:copper resistance CopC family protein [Pseudonocardia spinosispora]|uniref:copper resistance CopC family protein n=1 Tax=Pseudonocardia spinosispora TaxID=103441 RepID=UPI00041CA0EA|nr:copper resistance CopC family protein [Pseudonocardia spinosispora]